MITQLHLENWKSYENASLEVDPLTILIGTNASGKSNALDAFLLLNRVAGGAMLSAALQGDGALTALRGGIEWAARCPKSTFAISVVCRADEVTDYQYRLECRIVENRCDVWSEQLHRVKYRQNKDGKRTKATAGKIKIFRTDPCEKNSPTIVGRLYNEKQGAPRTLGRSHALLFQLSGQKSRKEVEDGVNEVVSSLKDIFLLDPIPSHMRNYSPLSDKLDSDAKNIAGVISALPLEKQQEIENALTEYASKLPERDIRRVYAEKVGKFESDAMLYCEEIWADRIEPLTVDARGMSDGTLRFLAILTALLTRPPGSLLVVEEIDNGLHPSRAKMLLQMLRSIGGGRQVDVIATTHNPALLDAMGPDMVPFITVAHRDKASGHSTLVLLEDIKELPKLLAQGSLGRLSSRGLIERSLQKSFDFEKDDEDEEFLR